MELKSRHPGGRKPGSRVVVNAAGPRLTTRRGDSIFRLLDANANRAREGFRILEDTARFVLERPDMAKTLRALRHGVDELVRKHYRQLISARDAENDSGRSNAAKPYKGGMKDLLAANFKRCEEALRVLEEYGRVMSPGAVKKAQAIRFQAYTCEKKLTWPRPS